MPAVECDAVRTACQLALALHLARFSAGHDSLTKIANRRSFDAALEVAAAQSARYGWAFTLVLVDLNDFKAVNDVSGHDFGDNLLRQFGFALRQSVRQGDTAARFGGDEFAVILNNAEGHESIGFTERLRANLVASGNSVDFSTGTASSPRDSTDPGELLRIADGRLYGKGAGDDDVAHGRGLRTRAAFPARGRQRGITRARGRRRRRRSLLMVTAKTRRRPGRSRSRSPASTTPRRS